VREMTDPKDRQEADKGEPDEESSKEELDGDKASQEFFGKKMKNLLSDELEVKDEAAQRTPMDSPSVQFFGESLEEFVSNEGDEEIEEPKPVEETDDEQ
jgi:hypothetical protein